MSIYTTQEIEQEILEERYSKLFDKSFAGIVDNEDINGETEYCIAAALTWPKPYNKISGFNKFGHEGKILSNPESQLFVNKLTEALKNGSEERFCYIEIKPLYKYDHDQLILDSLNLLTENGAAIIFISGYYYPNIWRLLEDSAEFHINGIFGEHDGRNDAHSDADKEFLLPIFCKCFCVVVSRKETDFVLMHTEHANAFIETEETIENFRILYSNDRKLITESANFLEIDNPNLFPRIIEGQGDIFVKKKDIANIEEFYLKSEMSFLESSHHEKERLYQVSKILKLTSYPINAMLFAQDEAKLNAQTFDKVALDKASNDVLDSLSQTRSNSIETHMQDFNNAKQFMSLFIKYAKRNNYLKSNFRDLILVRRFKYRYTRKKFEFFWPSDWDWGELESWSDVDNKIELFAIFGEKINLNYLKMFMETGIGNLENQRVLARYQGGEEALNNILIPILSESDQTQIASALTNANSLEIEIQSLKNQLIDNPELCTEVDESFNDWLIKLDRVSLDKKINSLIKNGESDAIEFKSSFSLDLKNKSKENFIEHNCFKTIAGFLNNKGGELLVGVADDGEIIGINSEVDKFHKSSKDNFLLYFLNKLRAKDNIKEKFLPFIYYELKEINKKLVFYVRVKKSNSPCFMLHNNKEVFYTRQNPGTIELGGLEMVNYIQNRFEKSSSF